MKRICALLLCGALLFPQGAGAADAWPDSMCSAAVPSPGKLTVVAMSSSEGKNERNEASSPK